MSSWVIYDSIPGLTASKSHSALKTASKPVRLLYVGNIIPGKGQDLALRAFKKALRHNSDMRLKFIGGDFGIKKNQRFLKSLHHMVEELALTEYVEFNGPSDNIPMEMSGSDIVLNFSVSESFSMVCLEALACSVPVIASKSGGPEEIVRHNVNGILVENRNIDQMAGSIIQLVENQDLRVRFSQSYQD